MVNGLGVVGWGVGGIEAEAAMLGQPISMLIPRVVGFKLSGELPEGATATDLVLTITEMLRKHGVVGKFVEFYGDGVGAVPLANRATIGNMSPEYGSTIAVFPIDEETTKYMKFTGRSDEQIALVEAYAKAQGMWHDADKEPRFSEKLELDLGDVVPSIAGPKRPQDRVSLTDAKESFRGALADYVDNDDEQAIGEYDAAVEESFPASDPPSSSEDNGKNGHKPRLTTAPADGKRPSNPQRVTLDDGTEYDLDHGAVDHRGHHVVHQHVEPDGHDRRRAAGQERRREGPHPQAVGQDDARARLEGRVGLLREVRPDAVPRQARVQPRRLRLHHVHRQLRAAHPRGRRSRQRGRPRRRLGALRQPQLRGTHQPRHQDELPRLAATGRRVRPRRVDGRRPARRPARAGRPTATTSS